MHLYAASACKGPNRLIRQLTMTNPAHDVATGELCMVKTNAILVTLDLRAKKRWNNSLIVTVMLYSLTAAWTAWKSCCKYYYYNGLQCGPWIFDCNHRMCNFSAQAL